MSCNFCPHCRERATNRAYLNLAEAVSIGAQTALAATIAARAAFAYGLSVERLLGADRSQPVALARQIGYYLTRETTTLSWAQIGACFGNREHATILHGHRLVKNLIAERPIFASEIARLRDSIAAARKAA
jgi:chromosomal replication initiator protein